MRDASDIEIAGGLTTMRVLPLGVWTVAASRPPDWQIYIGLAFWTLGLAVFVHLMPSYWREPNPNFARVPWFWFWGEALYRGFIVRGLPVVMSLAIGIEVMLIYSLVFAPGYGNVFVFFALLGIFMAVLLVWASVALFNQPKFVVPPYMRDEPGAASEWLRSRGTRRRQVVLWLGVTVFWVVIMVFIFAGGARKLVDLLQALPH